MTNDSTPVETTATTTLTASEPDPRRWWSLAVIAMAQLMIVLDASVVIVALPSAQRALHISIANRQWVVSAYTLAFGSLLLLGGRIADYLGRRRMFIVGLIGFGLSSALGGLAQNAAMLFGARALQGAFGAIMAPAALSLLTTTFTEVQELFDLGGGLSELLSRGRLEADACPACRPQAQRGLQGYLGAREPEEMVEIGLGRLGPPE